MRYSYYSTTTIFKLLSNCTGFLNYIAILTKQATVVTSCAKVQFLFCLYGVILYPINQSINQWINQSSNQSINQFLFWCLKGRTFFRILRILMSYVIVSLFPHVTAGILLSLSTHVNVSAGILLSLFTHVHDSAGLLLRLFIFPLGA